MWQISIASLIGTYVGLKSNIYALSKFDILLSYKGFWLRTLFASGVGELVFTMIAVPLMFFGKVTLSGLASIVGISILVKFIYSSIFSYYSELIAHWLIMHENIKFEKKDFQYNPFKTTSSVILQSAE
jgi:uncharacterized PurR-regulated membrane protein YhhQ (DUF165 family)